MKKYDDMTFGELLVASLEEVAAIERGEAEPALERRGPLTARAASAEAPPAWKPEEIVTLRKRLKLSQPVFAKALNVSPETVRAWEQGKRVPDGAAARLIEIAAECPAVVLTKIRHAASHGPFRKATPGNRATHSSHGKSVAREQSSRPCAARRSVGTGRVVADAGKRDLRPAAKKRK